MIGREWAPWDPGPMATRNVILWKNPLTIFFLNTWISAGQPPSEICVFIIFDKNHRNQLIKSIFVQNYKKIRLKSKCT